MSSQRIEFQGSDGQQLAARMDFPDGAPATYALFAHCFTCSKDVLAASRISQALTRHGIAVLRFDFTGLGGSDGEFANTNFSSNLDDLVAAARYLETHHRPPALLIGHSWGGAAVLAASARLGGTRALVTLGAPSDPAHVLASFGASLSELEREGEATVMLAGRRFPMRRQFLEDMAHQRLLAHLRQLRAALLVLHSPEDGTVPISHGEAIFNAAPHPKSFVALPGADHLLTRRDDADYAAGLIGSWSRRYVAGAA
ncbi:putative redox protein [Noviherbaspirillum humi]|uniref:Putative redox protein n=1 Tax=Noviherbaspirillum humi TaxID=1688639 RepID=A0A239K006_9BURK|nr:alpha/beta fold hydrolase [Noviherbaspirillum humi]SNT11022.1 putative redox protein [Noviherbaspirillum humi]